MTSPSLQDVIKAKYTIRPLKPLSVRFERLIRLLQFKGNSLNPITLLLEAEDGKKYKLLQAAKRNQHRIALLVYQLEIAKNLDFVPKVIWRDPQNILLDYVAGERPDITNKQFAKAFGQNLAMIHSLDYGRLSKDDIRYKIERDLNEIFHHRIIHGLDREKLFDRLMALIPADLRTSLVYADLQTANFCFSNEGKLIFFDIGGFQRGQITDEFLLGHPLIKQLDHKTFKESYLNAGGYEKLFDLGEVIGLINHIKMTAFFSSVWRQLPPFQIRKRRTYDMWVHERIEKLRSFSNTERPLS